jgi:hypothetical protein
LVSPKRRTSQSFYPLAKRHSLQLTVSSDLDQRLPHESQSEFRGRIADFLTHLQKKSAAESDVIYACTHYDWIEEAMSLIDCDRDLNSLEFAHWAPTQYVAFVLPIDSGHWTFLKKGDAK